MYQSFSYNKEGVLEDIRFKYKEFTRGGRDNKYGKAIADYNASEDYLYGVYQKKLSELETWRLNEIALWKTGKSNRFKFDIEKEFKAKKLQLDRELEDAMIIIKDEYDVASRNAPTRDKLKWFGSALGLSAAEILAAGKFGEMAGSNNLGTSILGHTLLAGQLGTIHDRLKERY